MEVRNVRQEDHAELEEMQKRMGLDYLLPDLANPLFVVKKLVEKDGKVIGACLLRLTAETMLLLSPELDPREKMDAMESMQPEVIGDAWKMGLDDIEARIPDETEEIFEKRLKQLGWTRNRDRWHPWTRTTNA